MPLNFASPESSHREGNHNAYLVSLQAEMSRLNPVCSPSLCEYVSSKWLCSFSEQQAWSTKGLRVLLVGEYM